MLPKWSPFNIKDRQLKFHQILELFDEVLRVHILGVSYFEKENLSLSLLDVFGVLIKPLDIDLNHHDVFLDVFGKDLEALL